MCSVHVSVAHYCVFVCAKELNNDSPLNKVLITFCFALPLLAFFLLSLSIILPKWMLKLRLWHTKKITNKKEMLLVAFPPILTKIKCSQKLRWPLTPGVYWQRWLNSVVFQSAIRVFPEKLTSIWSEASWALSSALFQVKRRCGRSRKRREKELAGRGRLKQREFKVVFWARYNVLWHISDELLWFYCQTLCEPRLRTEACSCS